MAIGGACVVRVGRASRRRLACFLRERSRSRLQSGNVWSDAAGWKDSRRSSLSFFSSLAQEASSKQSFVLSASDGGSGGTHGGQQKRQILSHLEPIDRNGSIGWAGGPLLVNRGLGRARRRRPALGRRPKGDLRTPRWGGDGRNQTRGKQQQAASVICPLSAHRAGARLSERVGGRAARIPIPPHPCSESVDGLDLTLLDPHDTLVTHPHRDDPGSDAPASRGRANPDVSLPVPRHAGRDAHTPPARLGARESRTGPEGSIAIYLVG